MRKNRVVIVVVLTIVMFFVVRHCTSIGSSAIEIFSSCVLYPFLRVQQLVVEPMTSWLARSRSLVELEQKVDCLQKKCDELFKENIVLKAMHSYAAETAELREFNDKHLLHHGQLAQVLARHFSSNEHFFLVDAGSSRGIKKDMVALYENAIVGRVTQVYPWYCKVCLTTDADCKVAALCYKGRKKSVSGIHEGVNDLSHTVLRYVSHLESVHAGEDVLSSGEGLIFPRGFALGKISAAEKGELFYTVTIQPAVNFQTLRYCILIAKESIE